MMSQDLDQSRTGVTVYPAKHPAKQRNARDLDLVETGGELFWRSCTHEKEKSKQVLRSSFEDLDLSNISIEPSSNGFVYAVFKAYSKHHHLIIRPEDVWFAILAQLNFYINKNTEELRHLFVAHEGQKKVEIVDIHGIYEVDIGRLVVGLTDKMNKFIVDRELKDWILPNFTTTTPADTAVAAIMMMGSTQGYFKCYCRLGCGIPSVTLLGIKEDWASIRRRLDKLPSFGKETQHFGQLLMPVLDNFVQTFDSSTTGSIQDDFWGKICHHEAGSSGPSFLSGWITAFCFWNEKGRMTKHRKPDSMPPTEEKGFDCSNYPRIDTTDIPNGYVSVPVTIDDNSKIYSTRMVAGSVGMQWTQSNELKKTLSDQQDRESSGTKKMAGLNQARYTNKGFDTVRPVLGWWMYELKENEI